MGPLHRLLNPKSIAVVGGGTWCENVIRECRKFGFAGDLVAVHPARSEVGNAPACPSLDDLPGVPDAVYIGVNRHTTIEVVGAAARLGAGGAVCFASGFREATAELEDGCDLQTALTTAAGDMPILGPNCYGFINALDAAALWPDQHGLGSVSRGVAIISQSSNIALNMTMQARGLPIAYLLTIGNQAQTGLSRIGEALIDDHRVTAIGLHIEGIDDLAAFDAFARMARARGKPVVALKVGHSEQARAATISHTASIAGSTAGAAALFERLGIAEVRTLAVFLETLKLLHVHGPLAGTQIASLSCSGGEASLMADLGSTHGLTYPALSGKQVSGLREALGPKVALANPLDYHTYIWGDVEAMAATFTAMMAGDLALGVVVLDFPREDRCSGAEWHKVIEAIDLASKRSGKPMGVLSSLPETLPEVIADDLIRRGIAPLSGMDEALAAIAAASGLGEGTCEAPVHIPAKPSAIVSMDEDAAKSVLQGFGARIPKSLRAGSDDDAVAAAGEIGFPVVLKGTGIAHKTEAGAVALDLWSGEDVRRAAADMPAGGYLVEEMVRDVLAELLVGIIRDPAHGYVLTLAAGGIWTELAEDSTSLIVPASRTDIEKALGRLRIARILDGYRGRPGCDRTGIVDAVLAVQRYAQSAAVEEVEINPLLCGRDFAIAGDALIRCGVENDG